MIQTHHDPAANPAETLAALIDAHGARRVATALLRALLRGRRPRPARPPDAMFRLNAHLRRDIGWPPDPLL